METEALAHEIEVRSFEERMIRSGQGAEVIARHILRERVASADPILRMEAIQHAIRDIVDTRILPPGYAERLAMDMANPGHEDRYMRQPDDWSASMRPPIRFDPPSRLTGSLDWWTIDFPRIRQHTEPSKPTPPIAPTKSAVAVSTLDPGCDEEYRTLARSLGIYDPAAINAELEAFLAENFIEVYPIESVKAYLDGLCKPSQNWDGIGGYAKWNWYPLRKQDLEGVGMSNFGLGKRLYNAEGKTPVPFPVLETVKTIAERFGDDVRICVTEVERIRDPFAGVGAKTPAGVFKMHVIERWDEPKYRG